MSNETTRTTTVWPIKRGWRWRLAIDGRTVATGLARDEAAAWAAARAR